MTSRTFVAGVHASWRAVVAFSQALCRPSLSDGSSDVRGFLLNSQLTMSFLPRAVDAQDRSGPSARQHRPGR